MNTVLKDAIKDCYYLYSVVLRPSGRIAVRTEKIGSDGSVFLMGVVECGSEAEANKRCKDAPKNKIRYGDNTYWKVEAKDAPEFVRKRFAPDLKKQMTPADVLVLAEQLLKERYVTLSSNTGIEDSFDIGVQYVGADEGDADFIAVYNKFGVLVGVGRMRVGTIEKTEDCLVAEKVQLSVKNVPS